MNLFDWSIINIDGEIVVCFASPAENMFLVLLELSDSLLDLNQDEAKLSGKWRANVGEVSVNTIFNITGARKCLLSVISNFLWDIHLSFLAKNVIDFMAGVFMLFLSASNLRA